MYTQFDQVMNLVQPKVAQEAVKAYESNAKDQIRKSADEPSNVSEEKSSLVDRRDESKTKIDERGNYVAKQDNQGDSSQNTEVSLENQRAKVLQIVQHLSQDDLLSIIEWRGDLSLHANAFDTQLNI